MKKPRILLVGRQVNWMATQLAHVAGGFIANGCAVKIVNYHGMDRPVRFLPFGKSDALRNRRLREEVRSWNPDLVIFIVARRIFHFDELRSSYSGKIMAVDYDGPNWPCIKGDTEWIKDIDILSTTSRYSAEQLKPRWGDKIHYQGHGVDCGFFRPPDPAAPVPPKYRAELSLVGRATPRRVEFCSRLTGYPLALWGKRWSERKYCPDAALRAHSRGSFNVDWKTMARIQQGSGMVLNILQDGLAPWNTILNLQVFNATACGAALLTENVRELPETFEPGHEVLAFSSPEEMEELVKRYSVDRKELAKIAEAGCRRCRSEYTQKQRAREVLGWL